MHPMNPTIKAYIIAAEAASPRAERDRLALAANRSYHARKAHARKARGHRLAVLAPARRVRQMLTHRTCSRTPCPPDTDRSPRTTTGNARYDEVWDVKAGHRGA